MEDFELEPSYRLPVDVENLQQGQLISSDMIQMATGVSPKNTDQYKFKLLSLREQIERELWDLGNCWTLKQEGDSLRILTDAEASEYNARGFENGRRKMGRCFRRSNGVTVENLTDAERRAHEGRLSLQARLLEAQNRESRRVHSEMRKQLTNEHPPEQPTQGDGNNDAKGTRENDNDQ